MWTANAVCVGVALLVFVEGRDEAICAVSGDMCWGKERDALLIEHLTHIILFVWFVLLRWGRRRSFEGNGESEFPATVPVFRPGRDRGLLLPILLHHRELGLQRF